MSNGKSYLNLLSSLMLRQENLLLITKKMDAIIFGSGKEIEVWRRK